MFSDPLYTTGDWPQILKDTLPEEYLPRFTEEEKADLLGKYPCFTAFLLLPLNILTLASCLPGSADFYAIDSYRSFFIRAPENGIPPA